MPPHHQCPKDMKIESIDREIGYFEDLINSSSLTNSIKTFVSTNRVHVADHSEFINYLPTGVEFSKLERAINDKYNFTFNNLIVYLSHRHEVVTL